MVDHTHLIKFGGGAEVYSIPLYSQADYRDNFLNVVPRTVRVPGMDGGVDLYGRRRSPSEIGQVNATWFIDVDDRADMTAARDTLDAMVNWGRRKLWMQPSDSTDRPRWCLARINNISTPQQRDRHTDLWQRVTANWQVADPHWYALPDGEWYLDDGEVLDDGLNLNSPRTTTTTVNDGSVITLTNAGNAPTPVILLFKTGSETLSDLRVEQVDGAGYLVNGFTSANSYSTNQQILVDSRPMPKFRLDGVSDYANFTRLGGNGFIVLEPGANTINISGTFSGDITLETYFEDAWRSG
ncbi:MAG: phage tail family protein [Aggregatilineales bacterium]